MRPPGALIALVFLVAGCGRARPPESVTGTWQAFLGTGAAAKAYYGRPAPTEIVLKEDGTYSLHLMWGARSVAETGGTYEVSDGRITLTPREKLDSEVWPERETVELDEKGRTFVLKLPHGYRVREAKFYRELGF